MSTTISANEPLQKLSAPTTQPVLEVLDGVHVGVTLALGKTVYTIGSKPSADIVLGDSGIAPEHGVIRLHGRSVIIEAAGGDIGLGKHRSITQGRGCRMTLPVELKLGTAVLRIAPPPTDGRSWLGGRMTQRLAAVGGIGCMALIPLAGFDTGADTSRLAPPTAGTPVSPSDSASTSGSARSHAASRTSTEATADGLTAKLGAVGLSDVVTTMDGTRVVVSGMISQEQRDTWSEFQRWFDRTYGGRYILTSTVEVRSPIGYPKFDLQAISFGETPYVITADGQRRYPGAVLDKGWVIKEIGQRRLTLSKDGKDLALDF